MVFKNAIYSAIHCETGASRPKANMFITLHAQWTVLFLGEQRLKSATAGKIHFFFVSKTPEAFLQGNLLCQLIPTPHALQFTTYHESAINSMLSTKNESLEHLSSLILPNYFYLTSTLFPSKNFRAVTPGMYNVTPPHILQLSRVHGQNVNPFTRIKNHYKKLYTAREG